MSLEFVAHRAGNHPETLRAAEGRVDIIELDVHRGRGLTTEVRHAKRLWPTRRLWDRWFLLPRDASIPLLEEILEAAQPGTALWFDLKGPSTHLGDSLSAMAERGERRLVVSSKSWWLLRPFTGVEGIRTYWSVGNRLELAIRLAFPWLGHSDGVVIHSRLLSPRIFESLARRGSVFTWGLKDSRAVAELERLGVDGVIIDDLTLADELV